MSPCDYSNYPAEWQIMRMDALDEAEHRCQGCGAAHMEDGTNGTCLTVHHPDRDTHNKSARLTVLCARCHLAVESMARARQRWVETGSRAALPTEGQEALNV